MARSRTILASNGFVLALALSGAATGGLLAPAASAQDSPLGAALPGLAPGGDPAAPLPGIAPAARRRGAGTAADPTGAAEVATPGQGQATAATPARRRTTRRTRPPTTVPVRTPVYIPTTVPDVRREVEVPLSGLPDPVLPDPTRPLRLPVRRRTIEEDPYASLGLKSGGLTFYPAIEQGVGYDTNPDQTATNVRPSVLLRTDGGLRVQSNWAAHELTADLRGGYSAFPDNPNANRPDGDGTARLRIDIDREARIDAEGRYHIDTQRPGSPDLNAPVVGRPLVLETGAAVGVTKAFNRFSVGLRGSVDRATFEDARLSNGIILSQADRDRTTFGLRLRTAYELTPGTTPFVDALVDERIYDQVIDNAGFRRSSEGVGARAGTTFEVSRLLTGEISGGYQVRRYDDPRLRDTRGPVADAALIWSATPLTTVRFRALADIGETTILNSSGVATRRATLEVQHDFRRNLSLILAGTLGEADYKGVNLREEGLTASVKLEYRLTRWLALRASLIHERLKSTEPSSSYTATTYLVGMRFQP